MSPRESTRPATDKPLDRQRSDGPGTQLSSLPRHEGNITENARCSWSLSKMDPNMPFPQVVRVPILFSSPIALPSPHCGARQLENTDIRTKFQPCRALTQVGPLATCIPITSLGAPHSRCGGQCCRIARAFESTLRTGELPRVSRAAAWHSRPCGSEGADLLSAVATLLSARRPTAIFATRTSTRQDWLVKLARGRPERDSP